ncbi:tetratricopeptide repeat protein [bacterium]|nr:tetratricopeptide repeat protein [bacterium]
MRNSILSDHGPVFGREQEAAAFSDVLTRAERQGIAVLTVGPQGMGKSALLRKFREVAEKREDLNCTVRTFLLHSGTDPDTFLERLVQETFGMTRARDGRSWMAGPRSRERILAIAKVFNVDSLLKSLAPREWRPPSQILLGFFQHLSERMDTNRRLVFFIDPDKHLHSETGRDWVPLLYGLPPKFVLVFAQRPDDVLACDPDLSGAITIPEEELAQLEESASKEFIQQGLKELHRSLGKEERESAIQALEQLRGWPYAIREGLALLDLGASPDELREPADQKAKLLLRQLTEKGKSAALDLVYALAVLEIPVPVAVLRGYLRIRSTQVREVLRHISVRAVVSKHGDNVALFHRIFSDHVRAQIKSDQEWKKLNEIAASMFESRLEADDQDELALRRLPYHTRKSRGLPAYFEAVLHVAQRQRQLGLLADAARETEAALSKGPGPKRTAALQNSLGLTHFTLYDIDRAEELHRKALAISLEIDHKESIADSLTNLGKIDHVNGKLDRAEELQWKALAIYKDLGPKKGMADSYDYLGHIYRESGKLDLAEEMHRQALAISKDLGNKEGIADGYSNLGHIYRERGKLNLAEKMHRKALAINLEIGYKEGAAIDYSNLGDVYREGGKLELAEEMHKKALAINEKIGRKEGMSANYSDLGHIYHESGKLELAEEMHRKALAIDEDLGNKEGMAIEFSNLGHIYREGGKLDRAGEMHRKALAINEKIGRKEGMSANYSNLGHVYRQQGDLDRAEEMHRKALALMEDQRNDTGNSG